MTDRKAHWEDIYRKKSASAVSWYQNEPTLSLELIGRCQVPKDQPIIDVGGGASALAGHLLKEGFAHVSVLDLSATALAHAKESLGTQAGRIDWIEADVTRFEPRQRYALWHDRAVFHFLTDAPDRARYADTLRRSLHENGHVIIAAFAVGGPTQCSGLDVEQYDAPKLLKALGTEFTLIEERHELHRTPANKDQTFAYFRLLRTGANRNR